MPALLIIVPFMCIFIGISVLVEWWGDRPVSKSAYTELDKCAKMEFDMNVNSQSIVSRRALNKIKDDCDKIEEDKARDAKREEILKTQREFLK